MELRFESEMREVSLAGAAIHAICTASGLAADAVRAVELAVVELASNAVKHAYGGRTDGPIRVNVTVDDGTATVEVRDAGRALPPHRLADARIPEIPLDRVYDLPEGGFGLGMVRALVDAIEVTLENGWNVLRFTCTDRRVAA
jgi:serine/threonine-protein kinase RsbW